MAAIPTTVETPKMNSSEQFQAVLDACLPPITPT